VQPLTPKQQTIETKFCEVGGTKQPIAGDRRILTVSGSCNFYQEREGFPMAHNAIVTSWGYG
jgi:hypothetical protein